MFNSVQSHNSSFDNLIHDHTIVGGSPVREDGNLSFITPSVNQTINFEGKANQMKD